MPTATKTLLLVASAGYLARASETNAVSAVPTSNYINTVPGYSDLSTCAINVLSTIVRAQSSGCGDGGALTSYTCFCTNSSSFFSYEITSAISESCASSVWSAQASSAIQVFDSYCDLGVEAGLATTTANSGQSSTASATPIATLSDSRASVTSGSSASASASQTIASAISATTSTASNAKTSNDSTVAIAVGIVVPLCALALLGGFIWWRRRSIAAKGQHAKQYRLEKLNQEAQSQGYQPSYPYPPTYPQGGKHPVIYEHTQYLSELPQEPMQATAIQDRHELHSQGLRIAELD
ncbi:hypothetical protein BD289DRAFT_54900 [Coniella lustricola]|uniref:Extracellular membrane protein CFEM domain-containing protein n=1 Tax=Coniella lustricola TaxID=2025994 RepID=A0A2T3AI52_9PEZI|nr:hypothetical protein BD289DRAFT_54900 [Coniella lustricola]